MKKYLEDLKNELIQKNINDTDIEDIINDHEEMIEEALADGLSEDDLVLRFGSPKQIADELSEDLEKNEEKINQKSNTQENDFDFTVREEQYKIQVNLSSEDITIKPSNDDMIHVHIDGNNKKDSIYVTFENGLLSIHKDMLKLRKFTIFESDKDVTIELPSTKKISSFMIKNVSGDLNINDLNAQHLNINIVSGDIEVKQLISESVQLHIVSGDVSLSNIYTDKLHTSQVSGDFEISKSKIENEFESQTVSGDVEIDDVSCDLFDLDSVSGDTDAKEFYPNTIRFKSVSGDLDISNKTKKEIKIISQKTLSGDVNIDL
ncbi:MAG: DUF4097 family beta strand repeat-containing protein [Acholeplasmataceae bacterium]